MTETREFFFSNAGVTTLASPILTTVQTVITLAAGSVMPDPNYGGIATLVLRDDANDKYEIMNLVDRNGNTCIVERGAEGTTPETWPTGTTVRNSLTAAFFEKLAAPPASHFRTSRPYPYHMVDALTADGALMHGHPSYSNIAHEAMQSEGELVEGELRDILQQYTDGEAEALSADGSLQSGVLDDALIVYDDAAPEALSADGSLQSGVLDTALITYSNYPAEALQSEGSLRSGVLS